MCIVKLARILRQHLQWLPETRPSFAIGRVSVADSMDVGSCFVDSRVYQEASSIRWFRSIATNDFAVEADKDHIAGFEEAEMNAQWVSPERVSMLRITGGYVTADSQDVAFARPVAKCSGHVLKLPLALCSKVVELWYACSESMNRVETGEEQLPGRITSPWEIAASGRLSFIPWTCFSSAVPFLEIEAISGMISASAVGLILNS